MPRERYGESPSLLEAAIKEEHKILRFLEAGYGILLAGRVKPVILC